MRENACVDLDLTAWVPGLAGPSTATARDDDDESSDSDDDSDLGSSGGAEGGGEGGGGEYLSARRLSDTSQTGHLNAMLLKSFKESLERVGSDYFPARGADDGEDDEFDG